MAQGRSTEIISIIKWIRTSRLTINKSLALRPCPARKREGTLLTSNCRLTEPESRSSSGFRVLEIFEVQTSKVDRISLSAQEILVCAGKRPVVTPSAAPDERAVKKGAEGAATAETPVAVISLTAPVSSDFI